MVWPLIREADIRMAEGAERARQRVGTDAARRHL
jgi:hypothetical protein